MATDGVGEVLTGAYNSAREKVRDTYRDIAGAGIERQKQWLTGRTAGRDVIIPAENLPRAGEVAETQPDEGAALAVAVAAPSFNVVDSNGELVEGELLIRKGQVIDAAHAERAAQFGMLPGLLVAAGAGALNAVVEALVDGQQGEPSSVSARLHSSARQAVVGRAAGHDVAAPDGSLIVAHTETVTVEMGERARREGREAELIASVTAGAAMQGLASAREQAAAAWDTVKQRAAEIVCSGMSEDALTSAGEQRRVDAVLGRPVNRVVLDRADRVILDAGALITNVAVAEARAGGVLHILLDSVGDDQAPDQPANAESTVLPDNNQPGAPAV